MKNRNPVILTPAEAAELTISVPPISESEARMLGVDIDRLPCDGRLSLLSPGSTVRVFGRDEDGRNIHQDYIHPAEYAPAVDAVMMLDQFGGPSDTESRFDIDASEGEELGDFDPAFVIDRVGVSDAYDGSEFRSVPVLSLFLASARTPEEAEIVADWLDHFAAVVRAKFKPDRIEK